MSTIVHDAILMGFLEIEEQTSTGKENELNKNVFGSLFSS